MSARRDGLCGHPVPPGPCRGERAAARAGVLGACEPIDGPREAEQALEQALRRELTSDADAHDASAVVRLIWTVDHLDALRLLPA
ncbi:hypothetical protein [Streptomyces sp. NPDC059224]|uniref:hypothetical protein n=1 Tax=Streptomyces sp. NPDC059224 TaxID=3346775 RepID=UPI00368740B4